jgi:hypothetical protein
VFSEVNDPTRIEEDVMDPWSRLEVFDRLGAQVVDIPYVQPELAPGQGTCGDLLLLTYPLPGQPAGAVSARALAEFLEDFYLANEVAQPARDPDFQRMLEAIQRQAPAGLDSELPLLSIPAWERTHRRS